MDSKPGRDGIRFILHPLEKFKRLSLKNKLMISLIPPVVVLLAVTGYITNQISYKFIDIALERNVRVQTLAIKHEVENYLAHCKQDLLFASGKELNVEEMRDFLVNMRKSGGIKYREFAFITTSQAGHIFLVANGGEVHRIAPESIGSIRPNPLLIFETAGQLEPGEVSISQTIEIEYPISTEKNPNKMIASQIIRFATPYSSKDNGQGLLILSVDVTDIRDILSLYQSAKSPIHGYPRTDEVRFSYMFDQDGWMLFQSEDPEKHNKKLTTYLARSGYEGTLGKPGLSCAFRPSSVYKHFWQMVSDVHGGKDDLILEADKISHSRSLKSHYLSYAPILFTSKEGSPQVYGGIANIDRSKLPLSAGYKHLDIMFIITLATILAIVSLLFVLSRIISKPILRLATAVYSMQSKDSLEEIKLPNSGYETDLLKNAVNNMITTMKEQLEEIRIKDKKIQTVKLEQKALVEEYPVNSTSILEPSELPEILGHGPQMDQLKSDILKAARVDVDVLVFGETGTGKQLASEAIHSHSSRAGKPFISINCGALDENLLLDALFGHKKGAFTEAKTDRKGAFLEADGGTLFLDEIQSASPKVQQALLRSIAMRKIRPLGSDREYDVNVRLIAATNVDLTRLIEEKKFREDLYFRLKVISIHTPPLREHRDSIPGLAMHYLKQAQQLVNKKDLGISKGALVKMKRYDWPGNVRELINCLTRAAVMAEGDLIRPTDIDIEMEASAAPVLQEEKLEVRGQPTPIPPQGASADSSPKPDEEPKIKLNNRQQKAYPVITEQGDINRSAYQELIGGSLPSRTAIYDLNDMVQKGLLKKVGRGPATRYVTTSRKK